MAENYDFLRSFTFDGKETSHLFQIAKVNIPFLSKDNDFFTVGNTDGKHFRNTKLGEYSISIDGFIISDNSGMSVSDTKDELVRIINSDEPKQLILDLFPDRYFNAIYTGAEEYDATDPKYTPLTLTFDVPDALAHQIESTGFSNVESTSANILYDSEFLSPKFYYNNWLSIGFDKYNGSNTLHVDFTAGMPQIVEESNDYKRWDTSWFMQDYRNQVRVNVNKGDSIDVMASVRVNALPENTTLDWAGQLKVIEWAEKPVRRVAEHTIDIPLEVSQEFVKYTKTFKIESEECKMLSMNYGVSGDTPSQDFSQPMIQINGGGTFEYIATVGNLTSTAIKVSNNGTYRTYPKFTVKMNSDNALIAFLNENRNVLQFGSPDEVDYIEKTKLETVENWTFWGKTEPEGMVTNSGFTTSYPYYVGDMNKPNLVDGALSMDTSPHDITPKFTDSDAWYWHGPSLTLPIPPSSTNDRTLQFTTNVRCNFQYAKINYLGRMEINIMDVNHDYVAGVVFRDSSESTDDIYLDFAYQGNVIHTYKLDKRKFKEGWREINIDRRKDQIIYRLCSIKGLNKNDDVNIQNEYKFVYNVENTQQIAFFGTWFQRFRKGDYILMSLSDVKVRWLDTPYIQDVKNVFQAGDIVEVDVERRKLFINGVENGRLNTLGNEWEKFKLEIGDTYIQPVFSDFATQPEVNIEVHNSYL